MDVGSDMDYKRDADVSMHVHDNKGSATQIDADGYANVDGSMPCYKWVWLKHKSKLLVGVFVVVITSVLLAVHFGSQPASEQPAAKNTTMTVIVSIDALRSDFVDRYPTPNFHRLIDRGVRAKTMQPVFPSLTFPNHYSIVTGLYPESHGIVANTMYDPTSNKYFSIRNNQAVQDPSWWGGEPIWVTAVKAGLRAGVAFWPGSEAAIKGTRPTYYMHFDITAPDTFPIEKVLSWMDLPDAERPTLFCAYLSQVDNAGHHDGPDSPQEATAVTNVDTIIGSLLSGIEVRGLKDRVNVIVVSDHGMTNVNNQMKIYLDDYVDMSWLEVIDWSPLAAIRPKEGRLDDVFNALRGKHPNMTVWKKADVPARFQYQNNVRITPLLALADEGWQISARTGGPTSNYKGTHGYDNRLPNMGASFMAAGPGFAHGEVPWLSNRDVYSVLCYQLGLKPAPNNGSLATLQPFLIPPKTP